MSNTRNRQLKAGNSSNELIGQEREVLSRELFGAETSVQKKERLLEVILKQIFGAGRMDKEERKLWNFLSGGGLNIIQLEVLALYLEMTPGEFSVEEIVGRLLDSYGDNPITGIVVSAILGNIKTTINGFLNEQGIRLTQLKGSRHPFVAFLKG